MGVSKKKGSQYHRYVLTNKTSITYQLRWGKAVSCTIEPFSTVVVEMLVKDNVDRTPTFTVENMWQIDYKHPKVTLEVSK